MITSRHIQKVIWAAVLPAVLVLGILAAFSNQLSSGISLSYEQKLFDTDQVMTVNIRIDEDEWDDLLETAISETYYCCDIEINGETYYRVGIRAKGNTSLSMVASSDSDRYSFKVKFDEYVDGQTCYGLDKLVLNNNYSDATMMKEAVVYDMLAFLPASAKDVPCSVCGQIHEGDCPVTAAREKIDGLPAPDEVEAMNREKQEQAKEQMRQAENAFAALNPNSRRWLIGKSFRCYRRILPRIMCWKPS